MNSPCACNCDPSIPRVMLLRNGGELATAEVMFVGNNDGAGTANKGNVDNVRDACKQLKLQINLCGN